MPFKGKHKIKSTYIENKVIKHDERTNNMFI